MAVVQDYPSVLAKLSAEQAELELQLQSPELVKDQATFRKVAMDYEDLRAKTAILTEITRTQQQIQESKELLAVPDMRELAQLELVELEAALPDLEEQWLTLSIPSDPLDEGSCILEVRAGTGGDEASLFAQELVRAYLKYALTLGITAELSSVSYSSNGGYKDAIVFMNGKAAYKHFKFESGVHRVQRVPATEASGRIHTSTVSVVVLAEAPDIEISIDPEDIRIDVYRSSGPGGQSVNTTDSAVRIVHIPTNIVVTCQDQKSQLKNKEQAMKLLKAKLYDLELQKQQSEIGEIRQGSIAGGGRAAKIRTYNFPQSRVTDHRIKQSWHNITEIMEGSLADITASMAKAQRDGAIVAAGDDDED